MDLDEHARNEFFTCIKQGEQATAVGILHRKLLTDLVDIDASIL